jgi:hypothetical protein
MLKALRVGLGFRVAMAIAVLAALCLVAPPAVMAFGHGKNTVHCLTNADIADPLASGPTVEGRVLAPALLPPVEIALFGRVPDRLDRPPISPLSV